MAQYAFLNLDGASYLVFSTISIPFNLSEREAQYITTMLFLLTEREAWGEMSDSEWDTISEEIQSIIDRLTT